MSEQAEQQYQEFRETFLKIRDEVSKRIVGQKEIIEGVLICLMTGGHALLEGVPGLGKTLLIRTLREVLDLGFSRIQFTPDLMPADIIGTNVVAEDEEGRKFFEFQQGPVFANLILADEINRATPKTQSALLEAMQEKSVTVAGQHRALSLPFFVMATQNPLEMEGTYPLPEAQLDRFFFKLKVEYPNLEELDLVMERTTKREVPSVQKVSDGAEINALEQIVRDIIIAEDVRRYALRIVLSTHPDAEEAPEITRKYVRYGSSPRGAQSLILGAKVKAILDGRYNVSREDIQAVALASLRHRLILSFEGEAEGIDPDGIIQHLLEEIQ
ncbi:MAG: MoxR family ATPase [Candidatus Poribacteria bacterium]|nr:MoxR family ATPase [Candidatus Poribacteria bacterium]MDE0504194.1 MoxR family ATPase [Candidatus Poribacteria bacterium]